jgi:hypothetical protein
MKKGVAILQLLLLCLPAHAVRDPFSSVQGASLQQRTKDPSCAMFVVAIMDSSRGRRAIINHQGETFSVGVGEMVGEKKITAIEEDRVVLGLGGALVEITFLDL